MATTTKHPKARAVGVIRVSKVNGREGERFASPAVQRERIQMACEREGLRLLDAYPELDVSGGSPLVRRKGLMRAVEAVEAGRADVVVVAYFDRLVRSLTVQAEVLERVEAAGGRVLAADVGEVSSGTAAQWLSSTMLGMVAEYVRRTTGERTTAAQRRAVERGRPPFPLIDGLVRVGDGVEIDPAKAPVVREAVRMRARREPVKAIRAYLKANGIDRSYHGVLCLLRSRLLVGELHYRGWTGSVPAICSRDEWEAAQAVTVPRGRKPKSDRLLARLGVLRCGTCGARMVVGTQVQGGKVYPFYRCPPNNDCARRVTILADLAESAIVAAVRELLDGIAQTETADNGVLAASVALDRAQAELDGAIRAFSALGNEPAAAERLVQLSEARDTARIRYEQLTDASAARSLAVSVGDWDKLTRDEQRDLIRAVIERADVAPGGPGKRNNGASRLRIVPRPFDVEPDVAPVLAA